MHSAVLQNKGYIDFHEDNTVEVLAMGRLDEAIKKGEKRAATYTAKDADGNEVEYMVEWPGLTKEDIFALRSSKAGTYNDTGGIPFTAIVNPHTLEKMVGMPGGQSSKTVMEKVEEAKDKLEEAYGESLKRSDIEKLNEDLKKVQEKLEKYGGAKALAELAKAEKKAAKKGDRLVALATPVREKVMETITKEVDAAEEMISDGDLKGAKKALSPLRRPLKDTELGERVEALYEKTKAE